MHWHLHKREECQLLHKKKAVEGHIRQQVQREYYNSIQEGKRGQDWWLEWQKMENEHVDSYNQSGDIEYFILDLAWFTNTMHNIISKYLSKEMG